MTGITYNQGESLILSSFFQNDPPTFGPFYIGLGSGGAFLAENGALGDLNEITDQGYTRSSVSRDSTAAGWELRGDMVVSPELVFTNTHPVNDWEPVDFAFLTLSNSGTLDPAVLIAAVEFKDSIVVGPGQSLRFQFRFRQITTGIKCQRVNYADGGLVAGATVIADAVVL